MNEIKNILIKYWEPIIGVLCLVLSFILQLIKKKPIKPILEAIYTFAIGAINESEVCGLVNPGFKGADKLNRAVASVKAKLLQFYPSINPDVYDGLIKSVIEDLLTTPKKKGGL